MIKKKLSGISMTSENSSSINLIKTLVFCLNKKIKQKSEANTEYEVNIPIKKVVTNVNEIKIEIHIHSFINSLNQQN